MKKIIALFTNPVLLILALVISLGLAGYSYSMYQNSQKELAKIKSNPQSIAQKESKAVVAKVGALVALPLGENPTIATIADKTKLNLLRKI